MGRLPMGHKCHNHPKPQGEAIPAARPAGDVNSWGRNSGPQPGNSGPLPSVRFQDPHLVLRGHLRQRLGCSLAHLNAGGCGPPGDPCVGPWLGSHAVAFAPTLPGSDSSWVNLRCHTESSYAPVSLPSCLKHASPNAKPRLFPYHFW